MRTLTATEIAAIKQEIEKQDGNVDEAIRFCLGHHKLDYWHYKARRTFARVKQQIVGS